MALCTAAFSNAQNVGIGTATPVMPLHIAKPADGDLLLIENGVANNTGTNVGMYFKNGPRYNGAVKTIGTSTVDARMGFYTFSNFNPNMLVERLSILDNGAVGINTVAPSATLDVNGTFRLRANGAAAGKVLSTDANGVGTWKNDSLSLPYSAASAISDTLFKLTATGTGGVVGHFENTNPANNRSILSVYTNGGGTALRTINNGGGTAASFNAAGNEPAVEVFNTDLLNQGNGIECTLAFTGTSIFQPAPPNFVKFSTTNGVFPPTSVTRARIDATGKGFFNGGTQNSGADVAEAFAVEGNRGEYEPGDVLVISKNVDRTAVKSSEPYSDAVAGVYATRPGVLLTERLEHESQSDLVPMGVIGVIPTKVCGEGGPIQRGDFLVTSSQSGYAMKADKSKLQIGMVIGKALENFAGAGKGLIKVMVNVK